MTLTGKKYSAIHSKTGSDKDLLKDEFDKGHINMIADSPEDDGVLAALVYQIQEMQDELDYLRTEISSNKDNKIVIGGDTVISFGDMVIKPKASNIVMTVTHTDPSSGKVTTGTTTLTLA